MIQIPWSCVTALKLEPIGPVKAEVFGLRFEYEVWGTVTEFSDTGYITRPVPPKAVYSVAEPRRLRQLRDALGQWVDSPTGLRRPEKTPFYTALCNCHLALTEEEM